MIVKALEENGAKVYIIGRRKDLLEKVAKEEAVCRCISGLAEAFMFTLQWPGVM